jgi:hypothetical protein
MPEVCTSPTASKTLLETEKEKTPGKHLMIQIQILTPNFFLSVQ